VRWYRGSAWQRAMGIVVVLVLLAACGQAQPAQLAGAPLAMPLSGAVKQAPGRLLFDRSGSWWTYEPSTQQKQEIHSFPEQSFPATPAVAPDGKTVAFSVFSFGKGPSDPAYGTDLYLMNADGTEPRVLLAHKEPAETLTDPAWSADGGTIYFTRRSPQGDYRIERVRLDGSERQVVVEAAQNPTLSADGQHLAYISFTSVSQPTQLIVAGIDGGNPRLVLKDLGFQSVTAPRFAPTGNRLVFAGVPANAASPSAKRSWRFDPLAWARPRTALAHGVPWDLWMINADGSELRQLTKIQEDFPIPTWSPDGAWIGFKGEMGLYIVDVAGGQVRRVSDDLAASIAWLR
jgi:Tol biopolymer transport system component